ncbi:MAG: hypothetical protein BHW34_01730 [Firmicutes bacterium CAG:176_59_8]|nr:MAG: hypothetical protein BHW34_01730 [Firmicutes bacterium CAG:176_59_8]
MTLFDYYLQYMTELWEGKRPAPEGVTLPEGGDENARIQALGQQLQAMGMANFVRACAAQDGTALPEELFSESGDLGGFETFLRNMDDGAGEPAPEPDPEPDRDADKVQYLIDVLKRMDRKEFFKLSQITTKLDLDPEEFLYWLAHRQDYAGEEEQGCAALMDAALLRLAEEGRLDVVAALLSGDRKTFEALRCEAPELVHVPAATFEWYEKNYLDRDYPIRIIMRLNGVQFPD